MILGTVIIRTVGHQKVISFSRVDLFDAWVVSVLELL